MQAHGVPAQDAASYRRSITTKAISITPPPDTAAAGTRGNAPSIEREELRGISRTVAEIHWLLLILVLLYVIFGAVDKLAEAVVISAAAA